VAFILDFTAEAESNRLLDEKHSSTESFIDGRYVVVPKYPLFHKKNFTAKIKVGTTYRDMTEGTDFNFRLPYTAPEIDPSIELFAAIELNPFIVGNSVKLTYQTVGAQYLYTRKFVIDFINDNVPDIVTAKFDPTKKLTYGVTSSSGSSSTTTPSTYVEALLRIHNLELEVSSLREEIDDLSIRIASMARKN